MEFYAASALEALLMGLLTPLYARVLRGKLAREEAFVAAWYSGPALIYYVSGPIGLGMGVVLHAASLYLALSTRLRWTGLPMVPYLIPLCLAILLGACHVW